MCSDARTRRTRSARAMRARAAGRCMRVRRPAWLRLLLRWLAHENVLAAALRGDLARFARAAYRLAQLEIAPRRRRV
jgi:hypothetical protein